MPAKVWVDQGTEFSGEFRKFCTDKKNQNLLYYKWNKICCSSRAIKSLKNFIYRYMEENGDKFMRKMDSFLKTMNTRVNRSAGKAPKHVTNRDFLSIFYINPINQYKRPRFKVGEKVRISKKIFHSEKFLNLSSQMISSNLLKLLLLNHQLITFVENKVKKI